jgi:phosphoserine phosphatase RsbU/P
MTRLDLSTASPAEAADFLRRFSRALHDDAVPVARQNGYALGVSSPGGAVWIVPHHGCLCEMGQWESIPVHHRRLPAGEVLLCRLGGHPEVEEALRRLVHAGIQRVEREYEDEDLLRELGASWECLDTLYEVTTELQTSRNPQDVLASILERIAARRPGLHAVLWIEKDGRLAPAAQLRASLAEGRSLESGLIGRALRDRTTVVMQRGALLLLDESVEAELLAAGTVAIAPIATRERLVGALEIWEEPGSAPFDSSTVRLFEALALQAAHVVESDRAQQSTIERERLRSEIAIGGRIQETLLWERVPAHLHGAQIASFAKASHTIDGDFCEFFPHGDWCLDIVIGDVMGKGVPAALIGAAVKSNLLRALGELSVSSLAHQRPEPRGVVTAVHERLAGRLIQLDSFVSLSYNRFDFERRRLDFVGCGHPRTIHVRAVDGTIGLLGGLNPPIGMIEDEIYEQQSLVFEPGDLFLLYSDGVTEARSATGEQFGEERLAAWVAAHRDLDPAAICADIREAVRVFTGTEEVSDDLTCVAVRAIGAGAPRGGLGWSIEFSSDLDSLPALRAWIRAACHAQGNAALEVSGLLGLAATEAVANIIHHAYEGIAGKPIRAVVEVDAERAAVTLTHWGRPFRPPAAPAALPDAAVEHGRGLFIIEQVVDEVVYQYYPDGASAVRLLTHLRPGVEGGERMLATTDRRGDVVVVSVQDGVLDASNVKRFRQEVAPALEPGSKVVFDLGEVQFIDSSGLGSILSCARQLRTGGGELKLCNLTQAVRTLFELVRMHRVLDTYATMDEAVESFGR